MLQILLGYIRKIQNQDASITDLIYFLNQDASITVTLSLLLALGLLRLQQIYQGLKPGNESFRVEIVKRITDVSNAVQFLRTLEALGRWSRKYIILDCSGEMAKKVIINHVRDISLGRRTYHYLLSGLVSNIYFIHHPFQRYANLDLIHSSLR